MLYVALLRGINVGGNNLIKMPELKACFEALGFSDVKTYIQSGNVIFSSDGKDIDNLITIIEKGIDQSFKVPVKVVVRSHADMKKIIAAAPKDWGVDDTWKHNLIFVKSPMQAKKALIETGELKPDIETAVAGDGVIYQSSSWQFAGRTTYGKLPGKPIYQHMTIRNYNTSTKLLKLMDEITG